MGGCKARLFAENFDAILVVIVILAGDAIFVFFTGSVENIENYTFCVICTRCMSQKSQERFSGREKNACGSQERHH